MLRITIGTALIVVSVLILTYLDPIDVKTTSTESLHTAN